MDLRKCSMHLWRKMKNSPNYLKWCIFCHMTECQKHFPLAPHFTFENHVFFGTICHSIHGWTISCNHMRKLILVSQECLFHWMTAVTVFFTLKLECLVHTVVGCSLGQVCGLNPWWSRLELGVPSVLWKAVMKYFNSTVYFSI